MKENVLGEGAECTAPRRAGSVPPPLRHTKSAGEKPSRPRRAAAPQCCRGSITVRRGLSPGCYTRVQSGLQVLSDCQRSSPSLRPGLGCGRWTRTTTELSLPVSETGDLPLVYPTMREPSASRTLLVRGVPWHAVQSSGDCQELVGPEGFEPSSHRVRAEHVSR